MSEQQQFDKAFAEWWKLRSRMRFTPTRAACSAWREASKRTPAELAAPDLLEALRYVRRFVTNDRVDMGYIDAAIAKATQTSDGSKS